MSQKLRILLIEDNFIEIMKMKRSIEFLGLEHQVQEAKNGEEALEILHNKSTYPDIILLDLNMPKVSGIDFLTIIKNNESLRHIPVIVLTTSNNHKDLFECYKLGISGYMLKPLKYEDYTSKIEKLLTYWSVNELITY